MKTIFTLLLVTLLFSVGCKKKYTCSYNYSYQRPGLSLVGFSTMEINQMVVRKYAGNSNFSQLISSDTIKVPNPVFMGDTAYAKGSGYANDGFLTPEVGYDYKIESPSTQQTFTITNIDASKQSETWTQEQHCSPGSSQIRITTYSLKINGVPAYPYYVHTNSFLFCLIR